MAEIDHERRFASRGALVAGVLTVLASLAAAATGGAETLAIRLSIVSAACALLGILFNLWRGTLATHRRLHATQRAALLCRVRELPPVRTIVSALRNDREARAYARDLAGVLREGGWPVEGVLLDEEDPGDPASNAGVHFALRGYGAPAPPGAMELCSSLKLLGVHVVAWEYHEAADGVAQVVGGHRAE